MRMTSRILERPSSWRSCSLDSGFYVHLCRLACIIELWVGAPNMSILLLTATQFVTFSSTFAAPLSGIIYCIVSSLSLHGSR